MRQLTSKWVVVACVAGAVAVAACASIFGVNGGDLLDGSAEGGAGDAALDVPFDYVVFDAIDLDVNTAICDGGIPLSDAAVWVSASGNDQSTCGDQSAPCKTIRQALQNLGGRSVVYLDNSIFAENVVITQAGLTLQGGWVLDGGWTPTCNSAGTTIQGPDDGGSAAIEIKSVAGVTLRLLTIRSKVNGAPGTGESVYAVRAVDSPNVDIDNCSLLAQSGGYGLVGSSPQPTSGCTIIGGTGVDGGNGAAGDAGAFNTLDFVPSTAAPGATGQTGSTKPGAPGTCATCSEMCIP